MGEYERRLRVIQLKMMKNDYKRYMTKLNFTEYNQGALQEYARE